MYVQGVSLKTCANLPYSWFFELPATTPGTWMISVEGASFSTSGRTHLLLAAGHPPFKDPRIEWQIGGADRGDSFICIGLHDNSSKAPTLENSRPNVVEITAYRYGLANRLGAFKYNPYALALWCIANSTAGEVQEFGVEPERTHHFKAIAHYFAASAEKLLSIAAGIEGFSSVIAADLDSLLAGVALKARFNVPLIYDAHEIYYESGLFGETEKAFWLEYEKILAPKADRRFIASTTGADFMNEHYPCHFEPLPNCEPTSSLIKRPPRKPGPCTFLFQGGISRTRGLLLLVKAWQHVKSDAVLLIRGPATDLPYVASVKKAAGRLLGKTIIFPPIVTESELVGAAAEADVGLIPYEPVSVNNALCCPNKLSQYMAAGLPILSNELVFIRQVIEAAECGAVVDFTDELALAAAIDSMANDLPGVERMGQNAVRYFLDTFNWEKQSSAFYEVLDSVPSKGGVKGSIEEEAPIPLERRPDVLAIRYGRREMALPRLSKLLQPAIQGRRLILRSVARFAG